MRRTFAVTLGLVAALPAAAQAPAQSAAYDRAIAAGYKALTLCSAIFVAGRTQAQAEALELTGIYPEYDKIVPTLPAEVSRDLHTIDVPFDPSLPSRNAFWDSRYGCSLTPVGADGAASMEDELKADGTVIPPRIGPAPADPRRWPRGDAGIAPRPGPALTAAITAAFTITGPRTTGVLVVADGKVAAERYADGFTPFTANRTWSVAKSLTGTLVGAAVQQGLVQTAAPADIPEWRAGPGDPRTDIMLDHLLHMSSGLHSATAGNRTDAVYFGGTAVTEETVAWPLEAKPGTRFRYANNDILLAVRSLRATLGEDRYATFPQAALFGPLGMRHTVAEKDTRGNYVLSSQVWSTARDLARFGLLYLNDGVWNGERILPPGWSKYVATPSGPQPEGRAEDYGATFWLLNNSPGVPRDTYAAEGNRGQFVVIVPSRKVVIVRRGEDATGPANQFDIAKFTAAVLKALP